MRIDIEWYPQPRQLTFLKACGMAFPFVDNDIGASPVADFIGYGGAAGGGKTDALIALAIIAGLSIPKLNIGYFRREFPRLEGPGGAIMRSQELMSKWARWNGGNHRWTMPTGSILQFCHCAKEDDVYAYQSQQFDILIFDEVTEFTRFQVRYLLTRNRATVDGVTPFAASGTNPGQAGHVWFKTEFIDPGPFEQVHEVEVEPGEYERHIFIPSKLSDNVILERRDPNYRRKLQSQASDIRRMLLEGDWDIFAGQYYREFRRDIHIMDPFEIPDWWKRFRSLDYGLDCTACYWWAVDNARKCYLYRELYQPDLTLSQAAEKIVAMTGPKERISYTVASPDLWNRRQDTGITGTEIMSKAGLKGIVKANHDRVPGWRALREYLQPHDEEGKQVAGLRMFSTCANLIRTLPALIHDQHDPEDVSDKCEDHGPESVRYGIMSRPPVSITDEEKRERERNRRKMMQPVVSKITGY